ARVTVNWPRPWPDFAITGSPGSPRSSRTWPWPAGSAATPGRAPSAAPPGPSPPSQTLTESTFNDTSPRSDSSMTTPGPTRIVIIGCGIIGKHHAVVATRHPDFVVTGLVDPDAEAISRVADAVVEQGAERPVAYGSIAEALNAGADLAAICTPSGMHIDQAEECLAAGVHVVIEKPLDVSVRRGVEFARQVAKAEERGQVVSVISQHRFDPASQVVRETIDKQSLGTITSAV